MTDPTTPARVDLDELRRIADRSRCIDADQWAYSDLHSHLKPSVLDALLAELRAHREREASGGWIAVSERMPESTERVWFYAADMVRKGEFGRIGQWITSAGFAWDRGEVTHWMHRPLEPQRPAPPQ
jgi:hypothetical protein